MAYNRHMFLKYQQEQPHFIPYKAPFPSRFLHDLPGKTASGLEAKYVVRTLVDGSKFCGWKFYAEIFVSEHIG